jgi:ATP-dependent Clp protease, protease subunit
MIPGFPTEPTRPGWLPGPPPPAREPSWQRGISVEVAPPAGDLAERLLRRRILMVSGPLDAERAQETAARAMLADAEGSEPVQLYLNCPDADLAAAVMLAETLQLMRARVVAVANGIVSGAAIAVYASARHRQAHQHAQFRLAEPRATFSGSAAELAAAAAVHRERLEFLFRTIADATGRDPAAVAADLAEGHVLTAPAAADYGLVDEIVPYPKPGRGAV